MSARGRQVVIKTKAQPSGSHFGRWFSNQLIVDGSGFGLSCSQSPENETWLELPLSVKVQKIDYGQQEIDVVNPNKCFPSLNLSSSPFQFSKRFVKSYSLFSCP